MDLEEVGGKGVDFTDLTQDGGQAAGNDLRGP
jgi:hypothetical protein